MPEQHLEKREQSMGYKLVISEYADELLNNLIYYLIYRLKSEQAAKHLLDGIDSIYDRLETNPLQFPPSRDSYLANKGYHEAVVPQMDYVVIFDVRAEVVNVVGVFHQLENYQGKLQLNKGNIKEPIFITKNGYADLVVMSIETYEQIVETQVIDNAISEAEEEYEATGILLDAKETLASLRRKHFG